LNDQNCSTGVLKNKTENVETAGHWQSLARRPEAQQKDPNMCKHSLTPSGWLKRNKIKEVQLAKISVAHKDIALSSKQERCH